MTLLQFKIITPERVVFSEQVEQVSVMTPDGEITVLPHHIPLVTLITTGELRYKQNGSEKNIALSGGFLEVRPDNVVVVLADTAEHAAEIDLARAEAARNRALATMQEARQADDVAYAAIQAELERAVNRVKIANKYRRLPPI